VEGKRYGGGRASSTYKGDGIHFESQIEIEGGTGSNHIQGGYQFEEWGSPNLERRVHKDKRVNIWKHVGRGVNPKKVHYLAGTLSPGEKEGTTIKTSKKVKGESPVLRSPSKEAKNQKQ